MANKNPYLMIDKLRNKVKRRTRINIHEACYIIWAEIGACSAVWKDFVIWCIENKIPKNAKFIWDIWKSIYLGGYQPVSKARLDAKYNENVSKSDFISLR